MKKKLLIIVIAIFFAAWNTQAQDVDNEMQTRVDLDFSFKPIKKVKISFNPEFRFDESFSLDKYLINGEAEYKLSKMISLGARYAFIGNLKKDNDTEYLGRYAFHAEFKKKFNDFVPSLRIMYSDYADDEVVDKKFLRYKASLKYDVPNCKLSPFATAQFFQDLSDGGLYKIRYAFGGNYKLRKNNYLSLSYTFDYYYTEYLNKHIISLGYKLKF